MRKRRSLSRTSTAARYYPWPLSPSISLSLFLSLSLSLKRSFHLISPASSPVFLDYSSLFSIADDVRNR